MRGILRSHKKAVDDYFARQFEQEKHHHRRPDRRQTLQHHPPETRTLTREQYRQIYGV